VQGDGTEAEHSQPEGGPYWSLMFEVSESEVKAVNNTVEDFAGGRWSGVVRECVEGALNTKLIQKDTEIVSLYHRWVCSSGLCMLLVGLLLPVEVSSQWHPGQKDVMLCDIFFMPFPLLALSVCKP